ncbi:hypothetical protein [Spiribacter onubensis]|uniref:LTXXQ motif family protein n=1 Tax=Spiribacter onubensis TaxID=3122420 RepID=A0ABV3S6G0_9GAMM
MLKGKLRSQAMRIFTALVCVAALSGGVQAQNTGGQPGAQQQELQQLQQTLSSIRQQAMEENPGLQERQQVLQDQMMSRMRDEGVDPREDVKRLQDIARELRGGEVAEEQRAGLMEEYQSTRQALLDARRAAMQDERIKNSQLELQDDLVSAMTEQNADVPEMIDRFETLRSEMAGRGGSGSGQMTR